MKLFIHLFLSLCLFANVNAAPNATTADLRGTTNYYFSIVNGDDSRTVAQAMNPATPWKTLKKLNSIMSTLKAGDAVLFNRGETFTGSIVMKQSGTADAPIIFSAYGTGSRPVINGLSTVKNWTASGNGTWETAISSASYLNLVLLNGTVKGMGRFPNLSDPKRGYLIIESHVDNTQITDNELSTSVNWSGAEVVIRKNDWVLDRGPITNHSGNTLTYVSPTPHNALDGYGFFIQNSPLTLDQLGEWYFNRATKKLKMFFGSAVPTGYSVMTSLADTLVFINNNNYITIDNLCFRGANVAAIQLNNSSNVKIQNSEINYSGLDGISADNCPYMSIENNLINHSNNSGVKLYPGSSYASVKGNTVRNSGTIPGMGSSNNQQMVGLFIDSSPYNVIELNKVDSSGYCGITFTGDYTLVKNNVVNYFDLTVSDGGGIYTWGGWDKVGRKVTGNVVLNGIGAFEGTNNSIPGGAVGIYTDDRSTNVDITDNTIANCVRAGIYLHNSHEMNLTHNTFYNNGIQISMVHDALEPGDPIRNVKTTRNVISSSKSNQVLIENVSTLDDIKNFGTYDSNNYVRPTADNGIIFTNNLENGQYNPGWYDLAGWKATYGYDRQSLNSPIRIPAYIVNRLVGTNNFANGAFNSNIDGVTVMSSPGISTASFNNDKMDGGALQVSFDASGGATNDVGTYINFGTMIAGKTYLVKFSLLGYSSRKTMKCTIKQNGGTYNILSETKYFDLTTTRTENQFVFTAPSTETNAQIVFETGGLDCPFWLDNMNIYEADVTFINANDYMRFEYNATAVPKSVRLTGTYVDPSNKPYSGTIIIAPFSSIILLKQPPAASALQEATQTSASLTAIESNVSEATAVAVRVSPNPASENLHVALNLPQNTRAASMSIYSMNGVKLKTIVLSADTNTVSIDVSSFSSGVYIINISYDGHIITKKFVKQ